MFIDTTFPSKFYLYQLGNGLDDFLVFPKSNLTCRVSHTVKLAEVENNFIDGKIRLNLGQRNRLGAVTLDVSFAWSKTNYFDLHKVKKVFFSEPKPIFFYTYNADEDDVEFYYSPFAEAIEIINQEQLPNTDLGSDFEWIKVKLQLLLPFVFRCDGGEYWLRYYDYFNYILNWSSGGLYYGKPGLVYGVPGQDYGQTASNVLLVTNDYYALSNKQRKQLFLEREQGPVLVWLEPFFQPTEKIIALPHMILYRMLTNNNDVFVTADSTLKNTTAENRVYCILLYNNNSANPIFTSPNQSILIENVDNQSNLIIEWLANTASSHILMFLSYTQKLYDFTFLPATEIPLGNYRINQTKPNFLYFSALGKQNAIFAKEAEKLRLKKTNSFDITVEIYVLPTYVL
jgi:hypothetical protein